MSPRVSVVVVTYNSARDIEACLAAIPAAAAQTSVEVVVVDNASTDDSLAVLSRLSPNAMVIRQSRNTGFAAACNTGVAASSGHYVLLLNPDAVPAPGCIDVLADTADRRPGATPLGGRCVDQDGTVDPRSCWGVPTLWSTLCFATGLSSLARSSTLLNPEGLGGWQRDTERAVGVVTGFLLLIRRHDWDRLGGMDERFFVYGEDVDFSLRARKAGLTPTITPRAVVRHDAGASSSSSLAKMLLLYAGKAELMRKQWGPTVATAGRALLLLGVLLRAFAGAADYRGLLEQRHSWINGFPSRDD